MSCHFCQSQRYSAGQVRSHPGCSRGLGGIKPMPLSTPEWSPAVKQGEHGRPVTANFPYIPSFTPGPVVPYDPIPIGIRAPVEVQPSKKELEKPFEWGEFFKGAAGGILEVAPKVGSLYLDLDERRRKVREEEKLKRIELAILAAAKNRGDRLSAGVAPGLSKGTVVALVFGLGVLAIKLFKK